MLVSKRVYKLPPQLAATRNCRMRERQASPMGEKQRTMANNFWHLKFEMLRFGRNKSAAREGDLWDKLSFKCGVAFSFSTWNALETCIFRCWSYQRYLRLRMKPGVMKVMAEKKKQWDRPYTYKLRSRISIYPPSNPDFFHLKRMFRAKYWGLVQIGVRHQTLQRKSFRPSPHGPLHKVRV